MTIVTIPFREFQRGAISQDAIAHLTDKKTGKSRGLYIPPSMEEEVLHLLTKKKEQEKQKRLKALESICGIATGLMGDKTYKELKSEQAESKYGN